MKRNYTMSNAALKQRQVAAKRQKTVGAMTVARVSVENRDFAAVKYALAGIIGGRLLKSKSGHTGQDENNRQSDRKDLLHVGFPLHLITSLQLLGCHDVHLLEHGD